MVLESVLISLFYTWLISVPSTIVKEIDFSSLYIFASFVEDEDKVSICVWIYLWAFFFFFFPIEKIQYTFMMKILQKAGIGGKYLKLKLYMTNPQQTLSSMAKNK